MLQTTWMKGWGPPARWSPLLPSPCSAPLPRMLSIFLSREGRTWHHRGRLSDLLDAAQSGEAFTVPQRGPIPICPITAICNDNQRQIPFECRALQKEPLLQQGEDAPASPSPPRSPHQAKSPASQEPSTPALRNKKGRGKQIAAPGSCIFTHQKAILHDYRAFYSGLQLQVY